MKMEIHSKGKVTMAGEDLFWKLGGRDGPSLDQMREPTLPKEFGLLKTAWHGLGRRVVDYSRGAGYNLKHQAITGFKKAPKKILRRARHLGIGAVTGGIAGLGAIGLGATLSPDKAAALVGAAIKGGSSLGNYYGDKLAKSAGVAHTSGKANFWGKDAKDVAQYKYDKEQLKSPETIDTLTKAFGSRKLALQAIERGDIQPFLKNNFTDMSKIGRALKKKDDYKANFIKAGFSDEEAEARALRRTVAMAKLARDVNPGIFNPGSREQLAFKENARKTFEAQGVPNATQMVEDILGELENING